jgi:hypothetical protein
MTPVSSHPTPVAGPVFVRLLARVAGVDAGAGPPLAATLAQWIDWPRAVVLAGALDGRLPDEATAPEPDGDIAAACTQARAQLRGEILGDRLLAAEAQDEAAIDFAPLRARYVAHQRAALVATGRLRGRLRELCAACAPLARLAEVDAAMEQILAPREHALLSGVPDLLAGHFERLRQQAPAATPAAWLARFRHDMRELLLAELDLRFSPVDALLAALAPADQTP